jgi:hypothetical protein
MSRWLLGLLIGTTLTLTGCGQQHVREVILQQRLLPHPNPTAYDFDADVSHVKGAVKRAFDKWRDEQTTKYQAMVWKGSGDAETQHILSLVLQSSGLMQLLWKEDGDAPTKDTFTKPGNENDAYIFGGDTPVGESQVYFKDGQPLIYYANFHIHLTVVSPQKTRVEIFTDDSSLAAGLDKSWSPHGPALIFVKVDPTTIEQYQILLGIGEQLGTKDMPQLVTPGPDSQVRQIKKPRGL